VCCSTSARRRWAETGRHLSRVCAAAHLPGVGRQRHDIARKEGRAQAHRSKDRALHSPRLAEAPKSTPTSDAARACAGVVHVESGIRARTQECSVHTTYTTNIAQPLPEPEQALPTSPSAACHWQSSSIGAAATSSLMHPQRLITSRGTGRCPYVLQGPSKLPLRRSFSFKHARAHPHPHAHTHTVTAAGHAWDS